MGRQLWKKKLAKEKYAERKRGEEGEDEDKLCRLFHALYLARVERVSFLFFLLLSYNLFPFLRSGE